MTERGRVRLFVVLAVACALGASVAIVTATGSGGAPESSRVAATRALAQARREGRPVVVFRSSDDGERTRLGQVAVAGLGGGPGALTALRCQRVYVGRRDGLCLARGAGFADGYKALVLGPDLRVRHAIDVAGTPSRARVSPDGRYGAVTLFVSGHAYLAAESFSTETTLIDLVHGVKIAQLEQFTTFHGGRQVSAVDANFWGVTFARDSDRFYATLATGGRTYLVEGSVGQRTMRTIHENVECPSLSPDGKRIAFKKRVAGSAGRWRLTVLDLATGRETPLAEQRSVDDQAEWLDDERLLYGLGDQIWTVRGDGSGRPEVFRRAAGSPAVVRW